MRIDEVLQIFIKYNILSKDLSLKFLAFYCFLDVTLNLANNNPTDYWYNFIWSTFTLIEYSIFTFFIWTNIKNLGMRKFVLVSSILFIIFTTTYNVITKFTSIDSIPIAIETILIFIYSVYYLYEETNDTTNLFYL